MNVLLVTSWYPYEKKRSYGIFVKEHAHALKSVGVNVVVLAVIVDKTNNIFRKQTTLYIDDNGVKTIELRISTYFYDLFYYDIFSQFRLIKKYAYAHILNEFIPDVIHSNFIFPSGILGNKLAKYFQKPHVITEHWSKLEQFAKNNILAKYGRRAYQDATCILPVSTYLKNTIIEVCPNIDNRKIEVIPNVVDNKIFNFRPKKSDPTKLQFCAVGLWNQKRVPDKRPELLIKSLAQYRQKTDKEIVFRLVGEGDMIPRLKNLAKLLNFDVEFCGNLTKKEVAGIFHQSDFFVHASKMETFGVVVVEAFYTGTPVICSNVGALPENINSTNGVLCNNDEASWINAIDKAVNMDFDSVKISTEAMLKYNPQRVGQQILNAYKKFI